MADKAKPFFVEWTARGGECNAYPILYDSTLSITYQ
jgi:hypothetical protein